MTLPKRSAIAQIISNKLYFASYEHPPREDTKDTVYLCLEDYVHYDAFYDDFGPYNLAVLYRFCEVLTTIIKEVLLKKLQIFVEFLTKILYFVKNAYHLLNSPTLSFPSRAY